MLEFASAGEDVVPVGVRAVSFLRDDHMDAVIAAEGNDLFDGVIAVERGA